jgi:hypothetical protein
MHAYSQYIETVCMCVHLLCMFCAHRYVRLSCGVAGATNARGGGSGRAGGGVKDNTSPCLHA